MACRGEESRSPIEQVSQARNCLPIIHASDFFLVGNFGSLTLAPNVDVDFSALRVGRGNRHSPLPPGRTDIGLPSRPVTVSGVNWHEGYFAFAG